MNTWTIYMYTFPNGKRYIGKTKRRLSQRQGNTSTWSGYRRCTLLWKAIQKYGVENILQDIIIKEPMEDKKACEIEMYYIELYKTSVKKYGTKYGYNLTAGGDGVTNIAYSDDEYHRHAEQMRQNGLNHRNKPLSEEHKKKLSEAKRGSRHHMYGKHLSDETKERIGKANSKENMTEETRRKRSESKKKKVVATPNESNVHIVFNSVEEAAEHFNTSPSVITRWCRKQRNPSIPFTFHYYSPTTTERERRESVCNSLSSNDTANMKFERGTHGYPDPFGRSSSAYEK